MKIRSIELADISRYRGELMGLAIIFVILFHVGLPREDAFFGLKRMGNIGVDFFLFLSGMGLWFSWTKHPSLRKFYLRRFLRVYPTWLFMACLYYIPDFLNVNLTGHSGHSMNIIDLIGDITINWDFWMHNELTFWYIPAIMVFYLVSPFYTMLIAKNPIYRWTPVIMIMWCVVVEYITPLHDSVGHLEIFWSRAPIFFIGINIAEAVKRKEIVGGSAIWMIVITFIIALSSCLFLEQEKHGQFPLFLERMLYIPLTFTSIILFNQVLRHTPKYINKILKVFGALSLELYLIHSHFVLDYLEQTDWSYWHKFVVTTVISLIFAWLLQTVIKGIITPIENRIK